MATTNGKALLAGAEKATTITIPEQATETLIVPVRGKRPLIINQLSEKAKHDLLAGGEKKTAAERKLTLKHDPLAEYRASAYRMPYDDDPTLLAGLGSWFKGAMMAAALRVPGATKTEIGQVVWVEEERVPIYGIPRIFLAVTRSADINKTPDVRTRCIVPAWATVFHISYAVPQLNETSVINLLAAAGLFSGVGDWRPQKGKGTYGQFVLTNTDEDEVYQGIVAQGGRDAQIAAMADPEPYNDESAELLTWFDTEIKRRGKTAQLKGDA